MFKDPFQIDYLKQASEGLKMKGFKLPNFPQD